MSNLTAAIMATASTLCSLVVETAGALVVGQWAAALRSLRSACFIGGILHLRQASGALACQSARHWPLRGAGVAFSTASAPAGRRRAGCMQLASRMGEGNPSVSTSSATHRTHGAALTAAWLGCDACGGL